LNIRELKRKRGKAAENTAKVRKNTKAKGAHANDVNYQKNET